MQLTSRVGEGGLCSSRRFIAYALFRVSQPIGAHSSMKVYHEALAGRRELQSQKIFQLILSAARDDGPSAVDKIVSLASLGLGQEGTPEAERLLHDAMNSAPLEPYGRPADGIGHLVVTVCYEPIDRQSALESAHGFRIRKGPIMPQRQVLRERTLQTLEGVLERIESMEAAESSDGAVSS